MIKEEEWREHPIHFALENVLKRLLFWRGRLNFFYVRHQNYVTNGWSIVFLFSLSRACAAVGVFFGASVCTIPFINVKDPLICGMIEAPFNGLAAFCKDDRFLDRICDDCKKTGFFDMFYSTKFVKYRITQIVKPIDKALQTIQDYSQKTVKKVTEAVSNLQFTIKDLKYDCFFLHFLTVN